MRLTKDRVERLCSVVRKPGDGTGIAISEVAEYNLKLLVHYMKVLDMTSRMIVADRIQTPDLQTIELTKRLADEQVTTEPQPPPKVTDAQMEKNPEACYELFENYGKPVRSIQGNSAMY